MLSQVALPCCPGSPRPSTTQSGAVAPLAIDRRAAQRGRGLAGQANTPAVSCIRALTSPRWCMVSPKLISSIVSRLK